jgi:membrane-bound lytic murein transglycosylase F
MGKDLDILEAPGKYSADDLVRLVAEGKIEATVTDASLAGILVEEYPNLQFDLPITVPEPIGWVMRKNAAQLKQKLDEWLSKERVQLLIKNLRKKYFKANTTHVALFHADVIMPKIKGNQISAYDSLFKKEAAAINWDWRMLAALCYQESNFDPGVVSSHGAFGLMQLMPQTAMKYGCDSTDLVAGNIHAAAQLLKEVDRALRKRVPNQEERMKFVLASYNAGLGHVFDAMVIARHLNMPDTIWFGQVENALLMKSQREYYTLPGTKSGYCRCQETYHFVDRVLNFYAYFKKKVK